MAVNYLIEIISFFSLKSCNQEAFSSFSIELYSFRFLQFVFYNFYFSPFCKLAEKWSWKYYFPKTKLYYIKLQSNSNNWCKFHVDPSLERPLNGQLKMSGMVQRTNKTYVQFTRSTVNLNESKSSNSQRLEKSNHIFRKLQ